ncbi:hypothetical protein cgR_0912 [Corynebacterium glutamicum R]|uniref:Uncharacterized protein n=1 Tax=Corynebacterium glutamicum (strain R) TaxID=340322 RepID=A0AB72V9H4_CORGB|nr:hypothetical protein cgR_0912 [Corynebacterium glutamicum R]
MVDAHAGTFDGQKVTVLALCPADDHLVPYPGVVFAGDTDDPDAPIEEVYCQWSPEESGGERSATSAWMLPATAPMISRRPGRRRAGPASAHCSARLWWRPSVPRRCGRHSLATGGTRSCTCSWRVKVWWMGNRCPCSTPVARRIRITGRSSA